MLTLASSATDDPEFVGAVHAVIAGVALEAKPEELYIVKLDNWFGPRWLRFSYKALGALGVSLFDLRVPPFVPARVVSQTHFTRSVDGGEYLAAASPVALHVQQTSTANAPRRLSALCPRAALFWWSGGTLASGRGALMAYEPAPSGHQAGMRS